MSLLGINILYSVLQRAASNVIPRHNAPRVLDFSRRNSSNNSRYSEEEKVGYAENQYSNRRPSAQRLQSYNLPQGAGMKPPLASVNMNIPSPRIANHYQKDTASYAKPPSGMSKPGLPPLGQNKGFGAAKPPVRNVVQESYAGNRFNLNSGRNGSPYRF